MKLVRKLLPAVVLICLWVPWSSGHEGYEPGHSEVYRNGKIQTLNKNTTRNFAMTPSGQGDWTPAQALNGIDNFSFKKMNADGVPINALADDATFLRRVNLLLTGRLPEPETTRRFLEDKSPAKRSAYIDEVLESEAFNTYWSFWFQEYFKSTSQILRAGQPLYNGYFEEAVVSGKALDLIAIELMTTTGLTDAVPEANFFARAGEASRLAQDFQDNIAIHAVDRFLGVPLACISCHDGAYHLEEINLYLADKKRADLWGMAAFFSSLRLRAGTRNENNQILSLDISQGPARGYNAETNVGDRPGREGGIVQPAWIFGDQVQNQGVNPLEDFANKIVNDRQFARNFANRFWGHLFGLAMVEPMDAFDLYRIDPNRQLPEGWTSQVLDVELLEYMTDYMIAAQYNFRDYLRFVLNSATFQMSSQFKPGNWKESYTPYYTRFMARRLSAESVYDSIATATGVKITLRQRNLNGRTDVLYAHQLLDMSQPRNQADVSSFLDLFGRGDRYLTPRSDEGNISQALALMNSTVVSDRIGSALNRTAQYLREGLSEAEVIGELYLDFLCRPPTEEETAIMLTELGKYQGFREKAATAQWLLINKLQFNFIY